MLLLPKHPLYVITDSTLSLGRSNIAVVQNLLKAGIMCIQYREKYLTKRQMLEECLVIRKLTREKNCCFIVNDYVDVAMACEADGVHVGQDDMPLPYVRKLVGKKCLIGVSVRTNQEADIARKQGADYLGAGAVFPTATKQDAHVTGLPFIAELVKKSSIPIVAIGGINQENIALVMQTGVLSCALISAIVSAESIVERVSLFENIVKGVK